MILEHTQYFSILGLDTAGTEAYRMPISSGKKTVKVDFRRSSDIDRRLPRIGSAEIYYPGTDSTKSLYCRWCSTEGLF